MKQAKNKNKGPLSKVFLIAILFFSASTLFFAWKIADYLIDSHRSRGYWEELQSAVFVTPTREKEELSSKAGEPAASQPIEEDGGIPAAIDFAPLYAISKDAAAWLFSPGTTINYVVAQAEDNDYYLRRLLDGTSANGGTLFIDYRCAADLSDWNTVIYGHFMNDGTMFAELANYQEQAYYKEHPVMYLYLPGRRYQLELLAAYTTDTSDSLYALPASKSARDELLSDALAKSSFVSDVTAGEEDRLVTLSTCSYVYENARFVVVARVIEN